MASESDNMGYKVKHVEVTICMSSDCPKNAGPSHRYYCSMCRMGAGRHSKRCNHTFSLVTANNEGPGGVRICLMCPRMVREPHRHCCSSCKEGSGHKRSCDCRQELLASQIANKTDLDTMD